MQTFIGSAKRRLITALVGGVLCLWLYKLYLLLNNSPERNDSNLLVSLVLALIAAACIYVALKLLSLTKLFK